MRTCVSSCPSGTTVSEENTGKLCVPNDPDAREKVLNDRMARRPWEWEQFKKTLLYTAMCAIGIGLIWMTIVHLCPKVAPILAIIGAILLLIAVGILLLVLNSGGYLYF